MSHDVHENYNPSQTVKKNSQKHPVYEDKSDTNRKVAIVRKTLKLNYMFSTIFETNYGICYFIVG